MTHGGGLPPEPVEAVLRNAPLMNPHVELVYAGAIVVVLLGLASYAAWRQWRTLRDLNRLDQRSLYERRYQRAQAWRRLINSALMVVLAGMLVAWYGTGQDQRARDLGGADRAAPADGPRSPLDDDDRRFLNQSLAYWSTFVALLLVVVCLAFADFLAIRRFGRRQLQQIRADRRAMIERQVAEFRRQRNGF
jgi:hypothetical protein